MRLRWRYGAFLVVSVGVVMAAVARAVPANAGTFGQNIYDGYYAQTDVLNVPGRSRSANNIFYQGVTPNWQTVPVTEATYLAAMSDRLAGSEVGTRELPDTQQARAAAIIDMMLGQSGTSFGGDWHNGVAYAQAHYAQWANLVDTYNTAWQTHAVSASGNRWGVDFSGIFSSTDPMDDIGLYDNNLDGLYGPNPQGQALPDLILVKLNQIVNEDAVIFHNPDGTTFNILKKCDNIIGDEYPFPSLVSDWQLNSSASVDKASVYPGQTVNFKFNITNNGPDTGTISFGQRYQSYNGATAGSISNNPGADVMQSLAQGDSISSYTTYAYTIPANYTGNKYCGWIAYSPNGSDGGNSGASNQACVTVNQPTPSCGGANPNPLNGIDPSATFTVTASLQYQDQSAAATAYASGSRLYVTVTGPGGYNQDSGDLATGPPATQAISGTTSPFAPTGHSGTYTITYGTRGGLGAIGSCSVTFAVGYSPYFRIDGGDIVAGAGFVNSSGVCTPAASADVKGYNKGSTGNYFGAGAQMAAIALGSLTGFPTSANDDGSLSGVDGPNRTGLTFANTSSPVGNFASLPCSTNYVAPALTTPGAQVGSNANTDLSTLASGTYTFSGALSIIGGTLPPDRHITFVVQNGDVHLQNDIKYGAYGSVNDIPQFRLLIQNGSLNVDPTVNELHGVYDAQAGSTAGSGELDTCYTGATPTLVGCDNKLTFYGAVIAKTVLLHRTYGNLDAVGGVPAEPAETFQYTPELWAAPANPSGNSVQTYDAITSLPPVL